MLIKFLKYPMLLISSIIQKNCYVTATISGLMSFLIDLFSNESLGSIVGVIIFAATGVFSILIAREKWLERKDKRIHDKLMMELDYKQKKEAK